MSENPDPSPAPEETPPPSSEPNVSGASPSKEERTMAMLCHLLALTGLMVPGAHIVAPLILWLIKKDTMPFVDRHGKESINFQITLTIIGVACFLTFWLVIPILIAIAVGVAGLILVILSGISANDGKEVRYPYTIRFVK